jgi:hypothetical protein
VAIVFAAFFKLIPNPHSFRCVLVRHYVGLTLNGDNIDVNEIDLTHACFRSYLESSLLPPPKQHQPLDL